MRFICSRREYNQDGKTHETNMAVSLPFQSTPASLPERAVWELNSCVDFRGVDISCSERQGEWVLRTCPITINRRITLLCTRFTYFTSPSSPLFFCLFLLNGLDDDICGASLSAKYSSNLITLWNRIAPDTLPTSAITPRSTSLPFGSTVPEEGSSPVENGVEKMKDEILRSLPLELMPQGWYYRVWS